MATEELTHSTIAEMASRLQRREVSPLEVTQAHLQRIERLNGHLRAYITVLADTAMEAARQAEAAIMQGQYRGPLHGIPLALKDLYEIRHVPMTCGSAVFDDHVPLRDSTVTTRLRDAGAVLLGTLNMHEFAWGATSINAHFGTPRNPWDTERIPGGSSGGSGVATRADLAMATMGSDTGGSVRVPAALCGVVGLKPTYGRVSRYGIYPLAWSLDHPGPLAKTVTDAALMLQAIAGYDAQDPTTSRRPVPDYTTALTGKVRGLRVGVPRTLFFEHLDPDVEAAVEAALATLRSLGVTCVDLQLPLLRYVPAASFVLLLAEAYSVHEPLLRLHGPRYGADVRMRLLMGGMLTAAHYHKAQRFRTLLSAEVAQAWQQVDALITPTTLMTAARMDEPVVRVAGQDLMVVAHLARFTRAFNMTGLPAMSVPCGMDHTGLPIGLQIVGRPFDESTVLRLAYAYEQHTDWHRQRPRAL